jgi:hypothetical protein
MISHSSEFVFTTRAASTSTYSSKLHRTLMHSSHWFTDTHCSDLRAAAGSSRARSKFEQ